MQQYQTAWKQELNTKVKLEKYTQMKNSIECEKYVKINLDKEKCSLLCQLRSGILPLQLEIQRYNNTLRQDRLCKLCKTTVECELHFLFDCPKLLNRGLDLYNEVPECLNYAGTQRIEFLCNKPHVFGNYLADQWQTRTILLSQTNV